ncbi:MAG: calcium-binding protein [Nostocaceae cyanobacterium]|nr:calcium-binding protein [Nostocaceae cyanobacterium]
MPPVNDNFPGTSVTGSSFTVFGTNVGATTQVIRPVGVDPNPAGVSSPLNSVWWNWQAPTAGEYAVYTLGSNFDTTLGVYVQAPGPATAFTVAENDDINNDFPATSASGVTFRAGTGSLFYSIDVDGYRSATGSIVLTLAPVTRGTASNDNLNGSSAGDWIEAGAGDDNINGNGGYDVLFGGDGNDNINGGSLTDYINGGAGNDRINGNGGNDSLLGKEGNDTIAGGSGNDYIDGGSDNDTIYGNGGNDTLVGGAGDDAIYGASGNDVIVGDSGNDTIYGNGGDDFIAAADGDNLIYGGSAADAIFTGSGNDTIYGNGGDDFIYTGSGFDTVWLGGGSAQVFLETGDGFDTINNFQLGQTCFQLGFGLNASDLTFTDSTDGVRISAGSDLLAVVSWNQASTFQANPGSIFC